MKYLICILLFSCVTPVFAQDSDSLIYWKEDRKLSWQDFKYRDDFEGFGKAIILPKIMLSYIIEDDLVSIDVKACMVKGKSSTSDTVSEGLLKHEQIHFDIGEYYARKIRSSEDELNELYDITIEYVDDYLNSLLDEYNEFQTIYDYETAHGSDDKMQEKWNHRVDSLLNDLKEYE